MLACALGLIVASSVDAADPPKILLVQSPNAETQMARRLHAEFTSLGIAVVEIPDEPGDAAQFLTDAATREHAFAAIRVVSDASGATVWVADRLTDKILVRALPASRADVGGEVVALEVVELLRASLLELNLPEPSRNPSPPEVAALIGPAEAPSSPARPSRFRAELAPTVLVGPGGVGPTGHAGIALRYAWTSRLSSRAFVLLPVVPGIVRGPEGRAEVSVALAGASVDVALTQPSSNWLVTGGAAIAAAWIRTAGTTESPLLEQTDNVYAAVPALVGAVHRRLGSRASVGVEVLGGVSVPRPVIMFGERNAAHWGRPLVGASLALDLALD